MLACVAACDFAGRVLAGDPIPPFAKVGRWLDRHVPASQKVGSLSAGIVSMSTSAHTVHNLDGLISTHEFLDNYLRPDRMGAYLEDEGIAVFADYGPFSKWRDGYDWRGPIVKPSRSRLLAWWQLNESMAYCVYDLFPKTHAAWPADPFVQVQFDAVVHGTYRQVDDVELNRLRRDEPDLCVLTSVVRWEDRSLRHVMVDRAERPLPDRPLALANPIGVVFDGRVRLLSYDFWPQSVRPGDTMILRRQWEAIEPAANDANIDTYIRVDGSDYFWQVGPACHGTYPVRQWRPGAVVDETYALRVPPNTPPGEYPLTVGLWSEPGGWIEPSDSHGSPREGMVLVGTVSVR
jgi:hypothetical protein